MAYLQPANDTLTQYFGAGVIIIILMYGFPALCLFHIFQGKAGYLWFPLLVIAFLCNVMGLSAIMSCCAKGGNLK